MRSDGKVPHVVPEEGWGFPAIFFEASSLLFMSLRFFFYFPDRMQCGGSPAVGGTGFFRASAPPFYAPEVLVIGPPEAR